MVDTLIVVVVQGLYLMVLAIAVLALLALPALIIASVRARAGARRQARRAAPQD